MSVYDNYKPKRYVPRFLAYIIILGAILFVFWILKNSITPTASADNEDLQSLVTEKDNSVQNELEEPSVVLPVGGQNEDTATDDVNKNTAISVPILNSLDNSSFTVEIFPNNKNQSLNSTISIVASLPINSDSLEDSVTITPSIRGVWQNIGSVATFTPSSLLLPETEYTVTVNKNLTSLSGVSNPVLYSTSFQTRAQTHLLSVPYFRQEYARSCEAASLRMVLAYKGTVTDDKEIVMLSGYKPTEPNWQTRTWDNPYEMFVGYLDGSRIGYGMYASALAKAAKKFGYQTTVLTNPTASDLASAIWDGKPVVFWGYINNTVPKLSYFNTKDGVRVPVYSNEHARTIVGVVGSPQDPVGFYVHDPLSGRANEYWTKEKLEKHMSIFGAVSNQALVIE